MHNAGGGTTLPAFLLLWQTSGALDRPIHLLFQVAYDFLIASDSRDFLMISGSSVCRTSCAAGSV